MKQSQLVFRLILFAIMWIALLFGITALNTPVPVAAQEGGSGGGGIPRRLGNFQVEWYCNQRGYGVQLVNNDTDWACTDANNADRIIFVLSQEDFNRICQATYNNPRAYAVRDGSQAVQAYNWSCYETIQPTVTPFPTQPPATTTTVPGGQVQVIRLGGFRVDWYCNERGYGVTTTTGRRDWACTDSRSGAIVYVLGQADLNAICGTTYNNPEAYAVRDGNQPTPADNWSCYLNLYLQPPTATPRPTSTPLPPFTRYGSVPVDWACSQRGLTFIRLNVEGDMGCVFPGTSTIAARYNAMDYTNICQNFYNQPTAFAQRDQVAGGYVWACYGPNNTHVYPTPFIPTQAPVRQAYRLGEFRVEWYCNERGFGVTLLNNQANWACTDPGNEQVIFVLGQQDFNNICQRTYRVTDAFAVRDMNKPQPAYNWSCYGYR